MIYGDILTDQDLSELWRTHQERAAFATLLLHQRAGSNSLVQMDGDGRITAFIERPDESQRAACPYPWVNSVVQVLSRRVLDYIPVGRPSDLPRDVYAKTVGREKFIGVPLTGYRCAIDSPERYEEARSAIRQRQCMLPRQLRPSTANEVSCEY